MPTRPWLSGSWRPIPTHIGIPDLDTAAAVTDSDWPRRLTDARGRGRILFEEFPTTLTSGLLRNACTLSDVDFDLARAAANWFRRHAADGLTARQVPIAGLHAKWLDRNTRLVTGLSGRPELGLVKRPSRIQFQLLGPALASAWEPTSRFDRPGRTRPTSRLHQPQVILVTENKDTALFFPQVEDGIVIEGNGNAVTRLAKIPWIRACPPLSTGVTSTPTAS